MLLKGLKNANLLLAFLLELVVIVGLGYWGFATGSGLLVKIVLGLGAPILAIIAWWLLGAPGARWHLYGARRLLLKVIFFGSAAVAIWASGHHLAGEIFALLFILNTVLTLAWKQDPQPASA